MSAVEEHIDQRVEGIWIGHESIDRYWIWIFIFILVVGFVGSCK